jgi:hypothetical protein
VASPWRKKLLRLKLQPRQGKVEETASDAEAEDAKQEG